MNTPESDVIQLSAMRIAIIDALAYLENPEVFGDDEKRFELISVLRASLQPQREGGEPG